MRQTRPSTLPVAERAHLLQIFSRLEEASETLALAVHRSASDWWSWTAPEASSPASSLSPHEAHRAALGRILDAIRAQGLRYQGEMAGVGARHFPSLVCIPDRAVHTLARDVNELKRQFAEFAKAWSHHLCEEERPDDGYSKEVSVLRYILHRGGRARFNYWQTHRPLVVLDEHPRLVTYVWAQYKDWVLKSVAQVRDELLEQTVTGTLAAQIARDLEVLKHLPDDEPLARRVQWTPHPRANIAIESGGSSTRRFVRSGSLPIILPGEKLPSFRPLPADSAATPRRARRSDVRLADEALLLTTNYRRFREPHRDLARSTLQHRQRRVVKRVRVQ